MNQEKLSKNQVFEARVEDLTSEGMGVVRYGTYPLFVAGALPDELVEVKAIKVGKKFGYGRVLNIVETSPNRQEILDPIGGQIGTMTLQHMNYESQLMFKQEQVKRVFSKIGGFKDLEVRSTLGMPNPWHYRNKAQIPVREVKGQLETGFFRKNTHDLVPVEDFHIQDPIIDQVILQVRDVLRDYSVSAYNEESHRGLIRHIIVKRGYYTGQVMIVLVVNGKALPQESVIVSTLVDKVPHLVSLVLNTNQEKTNVIMGRDSKTLYGQDYYEDQMLGLTYKISAHSFFQVNTWQAERLYEAALEAANLQGNEIVLDAYCGIGTISLSLAQKAKKVYAMEIVPQAIQMAEENAKSNQINHAYFQVGKAEDVLPKWHAEGIRFDVVVVDPPRKGLDPKVVETLIEQAPDKIVYVSCNPATCARDCQLFAQGGYRVVYVQPCDMFPQTHHVECVVLLQRSKG